MHYIRLPAKSGCTGCRIKLPIVHASEYESILTVLLAFSTLHCNNLNCSHILLAVKHVTVLMVCCSFGIMVTECNHTQLDYLLITNHLITAHYFSLLYLLWSLHSCVSVKENMQCTWVLCMYIYYLKRTCNCGWVYNSVCVYMCVRVHVCVRACVRDNYMYKKEWVA